MSANNCAVLIGRVGRDPETRTFDGGRSITKFSIAVNRPIKDKQGNSVTDWFEVNVWGKQAELAQDMVRKGALISIAGAVHIDEWTDRDGNKQRTVKLNADGFQLLESRKDGDGQASGQRRSAPAPTTGADPSYFDDDIPPF